MQTLANHIAKKLESAMHCIVYEDDLMRVWPLGESKREDKIDRFARAYGFRLLSYEKGICAVFDKEPFRPKT